MELIFATNNLHKLREVEQMLSGVELQTPRQIGITEEIPETSPTIEGNALQKARYIHEKTGRDCFADDTGLEVAALGGAPGVYSARYAGEHCSFDDNMNKLLDALNEAENEPAGSTWAVGGPSATGAGFFNAGEPTGFTTLPDRSARFRTVIALIFNGKEYLFEGEVQGVITHSRHGDGGFGYDPIFRPDGSKKTFAEMSPAEKNVLSHRARAVEKLAAFLVRS